MLTRLDLRGRANDLHEHLPRPGVATEPPVAQVAAIVAEVRAGGDAALRRLTERFDGVAVDELRVPKNEIDAALAAIPAPLRDALEVAHANVLAFHAHQMREDGRYQREGVVVRELRRPVDRAGLYVPGGVAPLLSTVLMTAVPARVAGVSHVALCSPPGPDGTVAPGILAAAALAGVDEVYRVGGAQAIAALAYGTESIPPVDVVVGPGNVYVSEAKRQVSGVVGVPSSFAGPSEVVVVADETAIVEYAAIDLIVQVEHGPDSVAWLVTWREETADAVAEMVAKLASGSSRREIVEANLAANSYVALVDGPEHALQVVNTIAPEHLELMTADPEALVPLVRHAGAVFTGSHAPASVGDYVAGPSHVLPTYGSARFAGALGVHDFLKAVHVVSLDEASLARLAPHVAALAEAEGLEAHAQSVRLRSR